MALIPGWAADYRIFDTLDLKFNYLLPLDFSPFSFESHIRNELKYKGIDKIFLLGWSLGGFVAAEFAAKYPDMIEELVLISIRKRYREEEIAEAKRLLKKNKKGYLYKFYARCFSRESSLSWFKQHLFKRYCEEFSLKYLIDTLDYLGGARINSEELNRVSKIKIIHADADRIAPLNEAREVQANLSNSQLVVVNDSGHALFSETELSKYIW
jgi:pimeloyl-ACP methyl ester carboxylesterase